MATISSGTTTGVVLANPALQNPLTVTSAGYVDVNSTIANSVAILGSAGAVWTITNMGTVESIGSLGVGIYLKSGGVVTNGTSVGAAALIKGSDQGLVIAGSAGTVVNFGTIQGGNYSGSSRGVALGAGGTVTNAAGGLIAGAKNGVYLRPSGSGQGGTLINLGTIRSLGSLFSGSTLEAGIGAYVTAGSIVQNGQSGSAGGLIEGYFIGVRIGIPGVSGTIGTITNFGTINVVSQSVTAPFDLGVQVQAFSSIVNFGTITALGTGGGVGVQLPAGGVVYNGDTNTKTATIAGYIHAIGGGFYAGTTVVNFGTLESTQLAIVRVDTGATILVHSSAVITNYGLIRGQLNGVWTGMNPTSVGAGTITNTGTIEELSGPQTGVYSRAVYLHAGGTLVNGLSGSTSGLISAGANGIVVNKLGTVRNFGTIESLATTFAGGTIRSVGIALVDGGIIVNGTPGATSALIQAYEAPVYIGGYRTTVSAGAVGTVLNFATIAAVGTGTVAASAVAFFGGGTLNNSGVIASAGSTGISFLLTAGTITNTGTIRSTASAAAGIDLHAGGVITNGSLGLISGLNDGIRLGGTTAPVATITNFGTIAGAIGVCINPEDNGSNTVANFGAIIGTSGTAIRLGTISSALIVLGSAASLQGVVSHMVVGDAFDLPFLTFSSSGTATLGPDAVLHVVEPTGTVSIALDPSDSFAGVVFNTSSDSSGGTLVTEQIACFRRGTLILTEEGEVPVEALAIGDRVVTLSGRLEAIKWVGRRAYDGRFIAGNLAVLPIRIAAGALSDGQPARDLWLSPEHALYLDGVLVAAQLLVNGLTICREQQVERLEYFHIELDGHEVILAEGTAAESYVECDNRGMFQNAGEFVRLYPDDRRSRQFCAPRLAPGARQLAAIRAGIGGRAAALRLADRRLCAGDG